MTKITFLPNKITAFPSKYANDSCYLIVHGNICDDVEPLGGSREPVLTTGPIILRGQITNFSARVSYL